MIIATQATKTSTLFVQGILWCCQKINGRIAFGHGPHLIIFDPWTGYYQIKEKGEVVFISGSVSECLQNAAAIVLDYYAAQIVPSWEAA